MANSSGTVVKVFLLDDHDIVRQGLRDLLAPARDIRVVGDSGSAHKAPAAILRLEPDVMVLDLHLQDGSGVHVCRQVRAQNPSVQGLLLTSADDDEALSAAVLAGAAGFVVKLARSSDILESIRALGAGRTLMSQTLADRAVEILRARAAAAMPGLSGAEWQILEQVLVGRTDQQIVEDGQSITHEDVTALVERMLAPASSTAEVAPPAAGGKHRRTV